MQDAAAELLDVLVHLDVSEGWKAGPITLTGIGVPADRSDRVSADPTDPSRIWFSVQVPERLAPGPYTFAIRAESVLTAPADKPGAKPRSERITACTNPVTIEVDAGSIDLQVDPASYELLPYGETTRVSADFRQSKVRDAIEELLMIASASDPTEWENRSLKIPLA